jgi:hypothetical protein
MWRFHRYIHRPGGELGGSRAPSFPAPRCMHQRPPKRSERRIVPVPNPGRLRADNTIQKEEQTMTIHEYLIKAIQDDARRAGERDRLLREARRARRARRPKLEGKERIGRRAANALDSTGGNNLQGCSDQSNIRRATSASAPRGRGGPTRPEDQRRRRSRSNRRERNEEPADDGRPLERRREGR